MDTLFLIVACFALGFAAAWFGRPIVKALQSPRPPTTKQDEPEPDKLPPGVVPMDAVPELRKQPKTTTNVRKLQSHRSALMELCKVNGLGAEARELIEDLDMEIEAQP
jgi:hypothetical protein